jgi:hypothetical protein
VFSGAKITDEWGVLNATGAVLMKRDSDSRVVGVVVQAPKEGALSTDSWTLELAKGWKLVKGPRSGDWQVVKE